MPLNPGERAIVLLRNLVEDGDTHDAAIADGSTIETNGDAEAWFDEAIAVVKAADELRRPSPSEDLGADSLDSIDLVLALEEFVLVSKALVSSLQSEIDSLREQLGLTPRVWWRPSQSRQEPT